VHLVDEQNLRHRPNCKQDADREDEGDRETGDAYAGHDLSLALLLPLSDLGVDLLPYFGLDFAGVACAWYVNRARLAIAWCAQSSIEPQTN
jgi:hypothetical protein